MNCRQVVGAIYDPLRCKIKSYLNEIYRNIALPISFYTLKLHVYIRKLELQKPMG